MPSLIEQVVNAKNPTFSSRVSQALLARALAALQENPTVPSRVAMAKRIITNPEQFVKRACDILAAQGLSVNSSDPEIAGAINAMTDLISTVFTETTP